MADIDVGPQSLREAAAGSRDLADELRAVDPRAADPIEQAMPGSGAATNAARVGDYWEKRLKRGSSSLDKRAAKLIAAAKQYEGGERDSEADFNGMVPEPQSPRPGK